MKKNDEVKKVVESLLLPDPSDTSVDIYEYIKKHKELLLIEYGSFIKQFEDFFNDMNEMVTLLNYVPKEKWSDIKKYQYLMFPETIKTLHRAFEDLNDGYYDESMMLNRSIYETFLRMVFLSCYPNDYEAVFAKPRKGKRSFNVSNFAKDDLKLNWDFLYGLMSAIHHSKKHKLLKEISSRQKKPKQIVRLIYESDRKIGIPMCVNIIMFNLAYLFHALISIYGDDFYSSDKTKTKKDRWMSVDNALLLIIETNPKPVFASIAADIKKIGRIMRTANEGRDWKTEL